jgi:hypothetical protein
MQGRLEPQPDKAIPGEHCYYCPYGHGCVVGMRTNRILLDTCSGEVVPLGQ